MPRYVRDQEENRSSRGGDSDYEYEPDEEVPSDDAVGQGANYFAQLNRTLRKIVRAIPRPSSTPREAPVERVRRQGAVGFFGMGQDNTNCWRWS